MLQWFLDFFFLGCVLLSHSALLELPLCVLLTVLEISCFMDFQIYDKQSLY